MHNRDTFSSLSNMKVCCVFSLESPHRGDSNEYTQHAIINIKRKSPEIISITISLQLGDGLLGTKNEFELAVVNEPLKFHCSCFFHMNALLLTCDTNDNILY